MNERIRELEKQCWSHYVNGVLIDGHLHFDTKKFAELIVQECCDVLQTETIRHDGYGYNQGALHQKIKEHFGVEK
jgi:hypothetical protein